MSNDSLEKGKFKGGSEEERQLLVMRDGYNSSDQVCVLRMVVKSSNN